MPVLPEFYKPEFLPARLCSDATRGVFIAYAIANADGTMCYKYIKLNKYKRKMPPADFATFAAGMIKDINLKLINTSAPTDDNRHSMPVAKALDMYLNDKMRELRPETMRTYKSFCKIFSEWCNNTVPHLTVGDLRPIHAIKFMEYYYNVRTCGNNSYNNNIKWGRGLFEWLRTHCYTDVNIFASCQRKRSEQKTRVLIDAATRHKIADYLTETKQYGFLLALHLVYSSLIRPKEIAELHIEDVKDKYIVVPGHVAKNHNQRVSAITPAISELLRLIRIDSFPSHYYLLGSDMLPSRSAVNIHRFTKKWAKLREVLHLPVEMQLYSLRDSGISDLLRAGVDPVSVMHHADHHSLEITTRYANHVDAHLVDMMYNRKVGF